MQCWIQVTQILHEIYDKENKIATKKKKLSYIYTCEIKACDLGCRPDNEDWVSALSSVVCS